MKWILFSDSHGSSRNMDAVIRLHADADGFLFLGDGLHDFYALRDRYPDFRFAAVRGNCDPPSDKTPLTLTLDLDGIRVFLCHGHSVGVKGGTERLEALARQNHADVALHGHTHEPFSLYLPPDPSLPDAKPLYLFCPGSISRPRFGQPAYGILRSLPSGILLTNAVL